MITAKIISWDVSSNSEEIKNSATKKTGIHQIYFRGF